MTGAELRAELGLRSTWFTIGVLRLTGGGTIEQGRARRCGRWRVTWPERSSSEKVGGGDLDGHARRQGQRDNLGAAEGDDLLPPEVGSGCDRGRARQRELLL